MGAMVVLNRLANEKTLSGHASMHAPQLVQSPEIMTGPAPVRSPFKAGVITWGSGQTA